jgi:hypothetical protein
MYTEREGGMKLEMGLRERERERKRKRRRERIISRLHLL